MAKPNMTRYMVDTYRDLQDVLERTHKAIDDAVDDAHNVIPSCTGSQFDLLLATRDRLVAMVVDVAAELDAEARDLLLKLEGEPDCGSGVERLSLKCEHFVRGPHDD